MCRVMRKFIVVFCNPKTKAKISCAITDQCLLFRFIDRTIALLSKSENSSLLHVAIFFGCTSRFVSDLLGNPDGRFSHNEAHIPLLWSTCLNRPVSCKIVIPSKFLGIDFS